MTTYSDTKTDLIINKCTKTQFNAASNLDPTQQYEVDPEFVGNKLLATDANGDIVETDQTIPTVDQTFDGTSANPQSGVAIAGELDNYEKKATIQVLQATDSITLVDNYCYQGGEQTSLTIAVPATATVGFVSQITFQSGNTATTITVPQTGFVWDKRGEDIAGGVFTPVANRDYTIIVAYNGFEFVGYSSCV